MTNAVGIRRQAGRGADGCCAVGRLGRVVGACRAAAAEEGAAFPLPGSQAVAGPAGVAGDLVRACTPGSPGRICRAELGFGSGVDLLAATRRVAASGRLGATARVAAGRLRAAGEIEWSRAVVDSSHVQAKKGAPKRARARSTAAVPAPNTTSSIDAHGIAARLDADGQQPERRHATDSACSTACRRCAAVPAGRADVRGSCSATAATTPSGYRRALRRRGITPRDRPPLHGHGSGLGPAAGSSSAPSPGSTRFKRLLVRYERRADMHEAFLRAASRSRRSSPAISPARTGTRSARTSRGAPATTAPRARR